MKRTQEIILKEKEIEDKLHKLIKLKKSWWKIILALIVTDLALPYIPLRNGRLIDKYGYKGAVLFGAVIYFIFLPLIFLYQVRNSENEIANLERDLSLIKRLNDLEE